MRYLRATGAGLYRRPSIPQRECIYQLVKVLKFECAVAIDEAVDGDLSQVGVLSERVVGNSEVLGGCANGEKTLIWN
jgi:hypothetical protein